MKVLRWVGIGFAAFLLLLLVLVIGFINSAAAARWTAARAVALLHGKLAIQSVQGRLCGPLIIHQLRYRDPEHGVDVRIGRAMIDIRPGELLRARVHILNASMNDAELNLTEPTKKKETKPFTLEPPIDMVIDRFTLDGAEVSRDRAPLLAVGHGIVIGYWTTRGGIAVRRLDVDSPQGTIRVRGELADRQGYAGSLIGRFDWRQGDKPFTGTLEANARNRRARVHLSLTAPLPARIDGSLEQSQSMPWQLSIRIPQFDPRERLLQGDGLQSLAAQLQGSGDLSRLSLAGVIKLNGEPLSIQPLRAHWQNGTIWLETLTLLDPRRRGRLDAQGELKLTPALYVPKLTVAWHDITLPPQWVGQTLATEGSLTANGTPRKFAAAGQFLLGPPRRLARVTVKLSGTPDTIKLEPLEILEAAGKLTVQGMLTLQPVKGWRVDAEGTGFDPGVFLAGWPGNLSFRLTSRGELGPQGPSATLDLRQLNGSLRQRTLSGQGSLALDANRVISGELALRSGHSSLHLQGAHAAVMNASAQFDVQNLDDWLPGASGSVHGELAAKGRWPALAVAGRAQGAHLAFEKAAADSLTLRLDLQNPLHPSGRVALEGHALDAAGFEIKSLHFEAEGNEARHRATLTADGEPLSIALDVEGARHEKDWSGSIGQLKLAATGVAALTLTAPAKISVAPKSLSLSHSCLAGDSMSICLEGNARPDGQLDARYTIEHLPLTLIAALAKPDLPFDLKGTLEGNGHIHRSVNGAFSGTARVTSAQGGARERGDADTTALDLLSYRDFEVQATLDGDRGQIASSAGVRARGSGEGKLQGQATLAGLMGGSPSIDGRADFDIQDLSPVALFAPQLADVAGRGEAHLTFKGPLLSPEILGSLRASGLAAEIPMVGLKLHDGALEAELRPGRAVALSGKVTSGDGTLELKGNTDADGVLRINAQGKNILAADIPAARLTVNPNLTLTRDAQEMHLTGTIEVPRADVDLTKLPKSKGEKASADVVVVDDPAVENSKSVPLIVEVTVSLGEKVKLTGFGLNATLAGKLAVIETPGDPTLGSGEIRVAGTYKAYGQDLTIQQGSLIYASTPLNNPQLSIIAVRTISNDDVTAKLTVTGTAQNPLLNVSSDQSMSQTEALSYLVTGKPMDQLSSGQGDMVQSAARSLGGAAGNLLAKNIGKRIGIDEVGIESSTELKGGSAFTVGQYLSPRLYLSYGVGLFEPGQVVTLRYRISDRVSLDASQGPISQRAGITYRVEK